MRIALPFAISLILLTSLFTNGGSVDEGKVNEEDRNKIPVDSSASPKRNNVVTSSMGDNFSAHQVNTADADTPQSTRSANVSTVTGSATTQVVAEKGRVPVSMDSKIDSAVASFSGDNFQQSPARNEENASSLTSAKVAEIPVMSDDAHESAANARPLRESNSTSDLTRTQNVPELNVAAADDSSESLNIPMKAYAKRVSLVSAYEKTDYAEDKDTFISTLTLKYRRKLCDATLGGYGLENGDTDIFVFDSHLYEFEFEDGGYRVSVAIHCPTKGFPEVFLRLPEANDEDLQLVLVRGTYLPREYYFRFGSALSITRVQEENDTTKEMRTNPIFGLDFEDRWPLCEKARSLFKYGVRDVSVPLGKPAAIYRVKIAEEEQLFAAIECRFDVPFYLLFNNNTREVKMTFENDIEKLIEGHRLPHKPGLIPPLTNIRTPETPS